MSRAEDMRHILNQIQNVNVNEEEMVRYQIVLVDDQGNDVDSSEPYSGTNYMMMTVEQMLLGVKPGWKLEIRGV